MFHARLDPGEENSGKLVSKIKEAAKEYSLDKKIDYIIVDGPPGIGCPVMASISGTDIAVIVTEPTLSGISDMQRASNVLFTLGIKFFVVINKFDINAENSQKIENICKEKGIEVIGKIPFDENVEKAIALTRPFAESFPDSPASIALKKILEKILGKLA
jgi:MinD superfamily P-loop ATPase